MPQETVNDHYVLILNIEKITKKVTTNTLSRNYSDSEPAPSREQKELVKLIVRDKSLVRLLEKAKKHLDLVTDEDI